MDITSAAIATIISATTASLISVLLANKNAKRDLDGQLDSIIKIAIQYPHLESKEYTEAWSSKTEPKDDNFLRYDLYCTMVFNYLSRLCSFYKFNTTKIEDQLDIKSWVRHHAKYWRDPTTAYENVDTYHPKFVEMVAAYLKGN